MTASKFRFPAGALAILVALPLLGCSAVKPNLLGGREKCWSDVEPRMATLMKGELELGGSPWHLATPEGELVTVFGGMDSAGVILVCGIEERHTA